MRTILGFCEIAILVWGIVECWGTPWSVAALVWLFVDICIAFYYTGKHRQQKQELQNALKEFMDGLGKKEDE